MFRNVECALTIPRARCVRPVLLSGQTPDGVINLYVPSFVRKRVGLSVSFHPLTPTHTA